MNDIFVSQMDNPYRQGFPFTMHNIHPNGQSVRHDFHVFRIDTVYNRLHVSMDGLAQDCSNSSALSHRYDIHTNG